MINYNPIFILGNPRSGTSLFRLMLNNHPKIVSPPECGFVQWWFDKYKNWHEDDNTKIQIELFLNDLFTSKKLETWNLDYKNLEDIILREKPKNFQDLTACVYLAYAGDYSSIRVISDKNNYYLNHLHELLTFWPQARIIHLIRDGRDVACSYLDIRKMKSSSIYKPILPSALNSIAFEWSENNLNISQFNKIDNGYLLLKYEDLISQSENSLKKVCSFLNVNFSNKMLAYFKETEINRLEPVETRDWKLRTTKPPDDTRIGRYKQDLTASQLREFNQIASFALKTFDYV